MLNLFQKYRRSAASNHNQREAFKTYFFQNDDHRWITESPRVKENFEKLFDRLPMGLLATFMRQPVSFVRSQEFNAASPARYQMNNTVVVFPEYQRLLTRSNGQAVAFLAHEVALVLYELEDVEKDPLMAEVEADKFVCDLGLADELEQFLLAMDERSEKRMRLTYLTFKALGIN